jgi:hypothetical protein
MLFHGTCEMLTNLAPSAGNCCRLSVDKFHLHSTRWLRLQSRKRGHHTTDKTGKKSAGYTVHFSLMLQKIATATVIQNSTISLCIAIMQKTK